MYEAIIDLITAPVPGRLKEIKEQGRDEAFLNIGNPYSLPEEWEAWEQGRREALAEANVELEEVA